MISITQLDNLPTCGGIYRVLDGAGTVIYVGQAKNIHQRWQKGHHKISDILARCGTNAFIDWVQLPEWLLNRAENLAVRYYKPVLNKKMPPIV
ncbi:GIY-YIG nuclease family protein [Acaryochloris sp. CCMEE 5410]|uniref:GIY-YIG nuclease family protein n=1 Tax=Acaryochloris sp. CCMEE 5410 TaxID=310037 RepID=UPI0002484475|nr:GIY-YIG nuclease family protein [Acaryochloris sp. CCMEE 5410]KAI9134005.1 GIY-YIG nuclease family protein [Acaryochloris sp. CCMEE 5410]